MEIRTIMTNFAAKMIDIAKKSQEHPEEIINSPQKTPVKKVDEVKAARYPDLKFKD